MSDTAEQAGADDGVGGLRPFHAMDVFAAARVLEQQGHDICYLQAGEPAVPPAPRVIEALRRAVADPQLYTLPKGEVALREALVDYYARQHGVVVEREAIMVTMGSSSGFILALLGAFAPGATIAVTRPGYPAYLNTTSALGLRTVEIPLSPASGWRLSGADVEAAYARGPFDGLLFASPANPTGAALTREGMAEVVATCARLGVRLISDEIYHGLDYRGPSVSAREFTDEAVIINSFSKYYCMTGYRVGWMVVPDALMARMMMLQQNLFIAAPSLSQIAARVALGERDYAEAQKAHYARNRALINAGLQDLGFGEMQEPDGAFYAFADVSRFTNDSMRFCYELLEGAGVATAPGLDFDRRDGRRFLRFSYAGATDRIELALERMRTFLRSR